MNCCCSGGDPAGTNATPPTLVQSDTRRGWKQRTGAFLRWALPITTLALVPKCPGCVAAYVLLATGVSLSLKDASHLRTGIIAASLASLALVAGIGALRVVRRMRAAAHPG
jgi:hypothetical protein